MALFGRHLVDIHDGHAVEITRSIFPTGDQEVREDLSVPRHEARGNHRNAHEQEGQANHGRRQRAHRAQNQAPGRQTQAQAERAIQAGRAEPQGCKGSRRAQIGEGGDGQSLQFVDGAPRPAQAFQLRPQLGDEFPVALGGSGRDGQASFGNGEQG